MVVLSCLIADRLHRGPKFFDANITWYLIFIAFALFSISIYIKIQKEISEQVFAIKNYIPFILGLSSTALIFIYYVFFTK